MPDHPSHTDLAERFTVTNGKRFRLKDVRPGDTGGRRLKARAEALLAEGIQRLKAAQERLYAQDQWALLLIFQAMDAAGKDGTIGHVMSGVNPQGVQVYSFKVPSDEERDHDFLWRTNRCLPERGRIGIFNRSYYEETLAVRVHPAFLQSQRLPPSLVGKGLWKERFEDINAMERYLTRNGVVIRKFFLHVSRDEQRRRFLDRLDDPAKRWKFAAGDVRERAHWDDYMHAYEQTIRHTATEHAPWIVVPADNKWFTRLVVADAIIDTLNRLPLELPALDAARRAELAAARAALLHEEV